MLAEGRRRRVFRGPVSCGGQGSVVSPRDLSRRYLPVLVDGLNQFNRRHPWSHNYHFHGWILRRLPQRRRRALDVGCGRGELLEKLAGRFDEAHGTDRDATMRNVASGRVSRLPHVTVSGEQLAQLEGPYDVITMVAVLHHLDTEAALADARRLLSQGGRLLVVGLARPQTATDWVWDTVCLLVNPILGLIKHPRSAPADANEQRYPVLDPRDTYDELRTVFTRQLPGSRLRRRIGFRYTAVWTKPV
jgi:SAM-dependent methyltransferase